MRHYIQRADIGVSMGLEGTEVAKGASDMILTDDNFCSIVKAIEKGRVIYAGIQKFVSFIMSVHFAEVVQIFLCIVAKIPVMRQPLQILYLILVTDLPPSIALGKAVQVDIRLTLGTLKALGCQRFNQLKVHIPFKVMVSNVVNLHPYNTGTAEVRAVFSDSVRRELSVSTYQACVLLLFNAADRLTYTDIARATAIPADDLKRSLQSLACVKGKNVLRKEPMTREVGDADVFSFNDKFTSKLLKVRRSAVQQGLMRPPRA